MYTNWIHVRSQILVDNWVANAESAWEPKDQEQNYTSNKKWKKVTGTG